MSNSAQVHSIDLLKRLRDVLTNFGVDAQAALGSAAMDILRVQNTLEDRLKHWRQQVNKRQEEVGQARAALSHARAMSEGQRTGCVEQEIALRKAQERVREAEDKVVTVRRWQRELPELLKEYEGPARGLSGFVEANLRQACALLDSKVASLEAYLAISAGDSAPSPPRILSEKGEASPPPQSPNTKEQS